MHGRQSMHEIQNEAIMISMSSLDSKNPINKTNKDLRRKNPNKNNVSPHLRIGVSHAYVPLKYKMTLRNYLE